MFAGWLRVYDWTLRLSLKYRAITLAISIAALVATFYVWSSIGRNPAATSLSLPPPLPEGQPRL